MKKLNFLMGFVLFTSLNLLAQPDDYIGYWSFDGNAKDYSSNENHGTVNNAILTSDRTGNAKGAYEFSRHKSILIPDDGTFDFGSEDFTISVWVYKYNTTKSWRGVCISKWNTGASPGTNEWYLDCGNRNDNIPTFGIEEGETKYIFDAGTSLSLNSWHHLVGLRRGNKLIIYIDGQSSGEIEIPEGTTVNNTGRDMLVGKFRDRNPLYFQNGKLDDIRIYDRALSEEEIQALYGEQPAKTSSGWQIEKNRVYVNDADVSIGNTNVPEGYTFAVDGKMVAKEINVTLKEWSDYVFEEDYDLETLAEIEEFIRNNKHLPGIPSAKEVKENGVDLGEMDAKLLEKIEELTLYVIEQNKRIEKLEKENKYLKNVIQSIIDE